MFPSGLFMVHNTTGRSQYKESENTMYSSYTDGWTYKEQVEAPYQTLAYDNTHHNSFTGQILGHSQSWIQ